tara:strand:- start:41 stop:253 length:213 start_codon:yes stop_codon:yes gene_type:complete
LNHTLSYKPSLSSWRTKGSKTKIILQKSKLLINQGPKVNNKFGNIPEAKSIFVDTQSKRVAKLVLFVSNS